MLVLFETGTYNPKSDSSLASQRHHNTEEETDESAR